MARNLDLTALRAFVTVVDAGGVTKASGFLNLTQSAVSMQIKRLEEALDVSLFNRETRRLNLTGAGEQMLGYARRMLELNDEVLGRLTEKEYEGEIIVGVPGDVVYPAIPQVLQRFNTAYPRMKVQLLSMGTVNLKAAFTRGEAEVILTTEEDLDRGGETLQERPMVWIGAENGQMWMQRPLRLAFERACIFRGPALSALDSAGISWEMAVGFGHDAHRGGISQRRSCGSRGHRGYGITLYGDDPTQRRVADVASYPDQYVSLGHGSVRAVGRVGRTDPAGISGDVKMASQRFGQPG